MSMRDFLGILDHASRWETEAFLKEAEVYRNYTEADLEQDLGVSRRLSGQ